MAHSETWHTVADGEMGPSDPLEYGKHIDGVELPSTVLTFVDRYDRVIGERDRYLWKWIHNLFEEFTLPCVSTETLNDVYETKTLLTVFVTVLDDLAELSDDRSTFDLARHIPSGTADVAASTDRPGVDTDTIDFLVDLWAEIEAALRESPRYGEFADVFEYDMRQTCNAMEYSRLLNQNASMANRTEAERYDAYNMAVFPYACIDLMHSPSFDRSELGALRSLLCELQQMARIGNWITTWERELAEGDISSGVVVCALRRGVILPEELDGPDRPSADQLVDRIESHSIVSEFVREWEIRNKTVRKRTAEIRSVDCDGVVDGFQTVMNHHLASEGSK